MKILKRILMAILLVLPSVSWAEIVKELNLHYELDDFKIIRHDNIIRICPTGNLWTINCEPRNEPALPMLFYTVAQLGGSQFYDIQLNVETSEKTLVEENVAIGTAYPLFSSTATPPEEWAEYDFKGYYPQKKVWVDESSGIWSVWVIPFEYDPKTGSVYLTKDFSIRVNITRKPTGTYETEISHNMENGPCASSGALLLRGHGIALYQD